MPKDQFDLNATNALAIYLPIEFREPAMLAQQIFHQALHHLRAGQGRPFAYADHE